MVGKRIPLTLVLSAVLAKGHVLLEDFPGLGKTLAARSLARVIGLDFARVQFTPDLLPADITGSFLYNQKDGSFEFRRGRCSPECCSRTRSTARPPRPSRLCWRPCRSARHGRGRDVPTARPVPRARDRQPDRVRGHLPAAGGAARPVPDAGQLRLPDRRRGARRRHDAAPASGSGRRSSSTRSSTRPGCGRCRRPWRPSPSTTASPATASTWRPRPASTDVLTGSSPRGSLGPGARGPRLRRGPWS